MTTKPLKASEITLGILTYYQAIRNLTIAQWMDDTRFGDPDILNTITTYLNYLI